MIIAKPDIRFLSENNGFSKIMNDADMKEAIGTDSARFEEFGYWRFLYRIFCANTDLSLRTIAINLN